MSSTGLMVMTFGFVPKRSGFDSTFVRSVFPAVRYVAPRRRCISHSEKPAPIVTYPGWLTGIDSHKGFASFKFALYFFYKYSA